MQVIVNGESMRLEQPTTLAQLLQRFALTPERVAIEVNRELVRRTAFATTDLRDGDTVEVVTLVGGG